MPHNLIPFELYRLQEDDDDFPGSMFGRLNMQSESEEDEDDAPPRLRNIL